MTTETSRAESSEESDEQRRRAQAVERLRWLEERIAERTAGSTETEEEIIEFSVKLGREINAAAAARWRASLDQERPEES